MRRLVALVLAIWALAVPALAQSPIPERRISVAQDTDFFGGDLRSIFDTTFQACRNACLADGQCRAFTFNSRSNACFTKSDVTDRIPYRGALSGEVGDRDPAVLARAEILADTLDFLSESDLAAALSEAEALPARHPDTGLPAVQWLQDARTERAQGNLGKALRLTGVALGLTDAAGLWTEYARLSLAVETSNARQREIHRDRALSAAINGYLRAGARPVQVAALEVMAAALERARRGRDTIPALRLAQRLSPRDDIAAKLDAAIARFGFRVVDTEVESDAARPRLCARFNEPLVQAGVDYGPFVQAEDPGLVVQAEDAQLCLDGVEHGQRYRITLREGLPAASGEVLSKSVALTLYVRDRAPSVRFPGRGYILPAGGEVALPVVTVNLSTVDLTLFRVSDRNVIRAIQDNMFARPVPQWRQQEFTDEIAMRIWQGSGAVQGDLNRDMTTRLPIGTAAGALAPGIYVLQAAVPGADPYENPAAAQWFVVSNLGLSALSGSDGLSVFVQGLDTGGPLAGVDLTLVSRANAVLGRATANADGQAVFAPGLTRGGGGAAPALLVAERGGDMAFLPLGDPEFDLSDRGVEGRAPAGPVDVFLTTDRGAYRAGEVVTAIALVRDATARALDGLPLTAILVRPDGKEYARQRSDDALAGGHVLTFPVGADAARGTWRLDVLVDPEAPPLASTTLLVEDFLPERIDADLSLPAGPLRPDARPPLTIEARYLFGAPGADLAVEAEVRVAPAPGLEGFAGYRFGRHDAPANPQTRYLDPARTDARGRVVMPVAFPDDIATDRPMEARIIARISEGSGRPIERDITAPLAATQPMIGLKPAFDGVLAENADAAFQVIATGAEAPMPATWTIERIETQYQWYSLSGRWEWEATTRRTRIATGDVTLGADPVIIGAPVAWGRYEVRVERRGGAPVAASMGFDAGWYGGGDGVATPDVLDLSLDRESYAVGETARLRIVPRAEGVARIAVLSDRVISTRTLEVPAGATTIDVPVTAAWGAGAYVTATVIAPSGTAGRGPARAIGLAHAPVDPGPRRLEARFDVAPEAKPRAPLDVALHVPGAAEGATVHAVISAIDVGILNLTGFDTPDPAGHYFGQRRLGVGIRDVYGRLIDAASGALGAVRSGGDGAAGMRMQSPPPTEALLAFTTGPLSVGADGYARTTFDLPAFDGRIRLMAVVWSDAGVGQAEREVLVRDPVVVTASLPRFLAPGDAARMLIEVTHASGPAGDVALSAGAAGIALDTAALPSSFPLAAGETRRFDVPLSVSEVGDFAIDLTLTTPGGATLSRRLTLPVRLNDPEVQTTRRFALAAGDTFTFSHDVFAGLRAGSGTATLSAGALARFDAPGLIAALDRYPYGCTEQVTSGALPLLYLSSVARAMGRGDVADLDQRIARAVARVLDNQTAAGSFGLWRPGSGDFWLDAYVTDFLSRARAQGIAVPEIAWRSALDNLRNRVNYAPDFDSGGEDIAYALHVLAREGAAAIGDLRYYADVKADAFATPLALAQMGAALAAYGDPTRADAMFARAGQRLEAPPEGNRRYRADYGTRQRDGAAVLTLAIEAGSTAIDRARLIDVAAPLDGSARHSTQEAAWALLAAHALVGDAARDGLTVDGAPPGGPLIRLRQADTAAAPVEVANTGTAEAMLTLTTFGVPEVAPPAGGEGYAIGRSYFDMDGTPISLGSVAAGTRLVAVLTVQPFADVRARLMVNDPLPAGFEIDNPNLMQSGQTGAFDWLDTLQEVETAEFRTDRFLAAVDWESEQAFRLAYVVRAVTPGGFHHPAASVEDMYRPRFRAQTDTGRVTVIR